MNQEYVAGDYLSHEPDDIASPTRHEASSPRDDYGQPSAAGAEYLTVGAGPQPLYAADLMARIERDSGYGSMASGSQYGGGDLHSWQDDLLRDRPTPAHTPREPGQSSMSENEKTVLASHVHQLFYNQNRVALAKAIGHTIELLKQLQEMNGQWPAHYPSAQRPQSSDTIPRLSELQRPSLIHHAHSTRQGTNIQASTTLPRPAAPRRAETSVAGSASESSFSAQQQPKEEPRLVTPQIAQEFSILKLDLKVGALSQTELVHSLEKKSIASLLDNKIGHSIRHLLALRDRIEDTSSKVLVTGDLNAGKSTFCNALLRRKILPEDQQPCTSIFCEVLDAKENGGVEEVHAVHKDAVYNRNDESTYDSYSIQELENIVIDNDRYVQCKIYVKDTRTVDESLLNNGVVDIALIDAPGLNADSVKTTAVFARQEEIDVVVFVVSAANHFTLSAKEFIWQAAHEKAYMFMVVNGFDNIRDKERCQRLILEQLAKLSPQTFKEAKELVHFVSSNAIPVQSTLTAGRDAGSVPPDHDENDNDDGDDGDDRRGKQSSSKSFGKNSPDDKGKGKGKDREKIQDFEDLEGALRRFVLEKRARSKLAPAKTYLMNCLSDIHLLATVNRDVAQGELDRVTKELADLEPEFEERSKQTGIVSEKVEKDIDITVSDVYDHTRSTLSGTIAAVGEADLGVEYPGLFSAFQYAEDLRMAMLDQLTAAVSACENYGRANTVKGVSAIKSLGLLHVGDNYEGLGFRSDMMFGRRKDALARTVDTDVEFWDFFDIQGLWDRQEKMVGTGMAMTVVGAVGTRAIGGMGWANGAMGAARIIGFNNVRRLIVPGVFTAAALTIAYLLSTIPQTLPPRLARKLSANLAAMDYTHTNAHRISSEVRRVLRFPAQQLTVDMQRGVEEVKQKKEQVTQVKHESEVARKYFSNLVRETNEGRRRVADVDLEGPVSGPAGMYA